jgi:hypothetical protein
MRSLKFAFFSMNTLPSKNFRGVENQDLLVASMWVGRVKLS